MAIKKDKKEKKKSKKKAAKAKPKKKEAEAKAEETEEAPVEEEIKAADESNEEAVAFSADDLENLEQALEALIFASPKPISFQRISRIFKDSGIETDELRTILNNLVEANKDRGIQIVKVGKSFQYRTHPNQAKLVQKLVEDKPARLSQSALEVLAIVAYKQPIVRAEIDAVRGIDSGHLMKGLLEKNLVRTDGHAEAAGRPLLYVTTPYFLEVFNLDSLDDLPSLEEFQRELGEGKESDTDENGEAIEGTVLSADPDFYDKASPLAAEPDRGEFDVPAEDEVVLPDFSASDDSEDEEDTSRMLDGPMAEA